MIAQTLLNVYEDATLKMYDTFPRPLEITHRGHT